MFENIDNRNIFVLVRLILIAIVVWPTLQRTKFVVIMESLKKLVDLALAGKNQEFDTCLSDRWYDITKELLDYTIHFKDIVELLRPVLTNPNHSIRSSGVRIISDIVCKVPDEFMTEKEITTVFTFMDQRLDDHESMQSDVLKCFTKLLSCKNKPENFVRLLLDSLQHKISVAKVKYTTRKLVYMLIEKILREHDHEVHEMGDEFIVGLINVIEGENHPDCLMLTFKIVSHVARTFELGAFVDDFSNWFSLYFPLDYTPPSQVKNENENVQVLRREELANALYECFVANPAFADDVISMIIGKIESSSESSRLDAYECLIYCLERYPYEKVKTFASSVRACVRVDCLVSLSTIDISDCKIRPLAYRALLTMSTRLGQDNQAFTSFTEDVYSDLSLAFIKLDLDLYGPATEILLHAVQPKISGFMYMFSKIMATKSMAIDELERKISSYSLIFHRLYEIHGVLSGQEIEFLDDIILKSLKFVEIPPNCSEKIQLKSSALGLTYSVVQCQLKLSSSTFELVEKVLLTLVNNQQQQSTICMCLEALKTIETSLDKKSNSIASLSYLESLPMQLCSESEDFALSNLAHAGLKSNRSFLSDSFEFYLNKIITSNDAHRLGKLFLSLLNELVESGRQTQYLVDKAISYWMEVYKTSIHQMMCTSKRQDHHKSTVNSNASNNICVLMLKMISKITVEIKETKITVPYISDLITTCLKFVHKEGNLYIRQQALRCLASVAFVHNDSDLIPYRPKLVQELRLCLADKKRIVRSQAVIARNAWLMVGQPGRPLKQQFDDEQ